MSDPATPTNPTNPANISDPTTPTNLIKPADTSDLTTTTNSASPAHSSNGLPSSSLDFEVPPMTYLVSAVRPGYSSLPYMIAVKKGSNMEDDDEHKCNRNLASHISNHLRHFSALREIDAEALEKDVFNLFQEDYEKRRNKFGKRERPKISRLHTGIWLFFLKGSKSLYEQAEGSTT
ncbi:hypothetical protein BS50DRAFT_586922 [Corynespora cassiicola Philippines]|uniref:Uncharacterized protein n=1 Tax=Corynespora cassiicola Philippines TaxID=1448308 RepID=A0A2T2NRE4_CORCC|nr:hypothetical protein BS50DRAFT_586922 [Corynespora cassiicola Philippines]